MKKIILGSIAIAIILLGLIPNKKKTNSFTLMGLNFTDTLLIENTCEGAGLSPGLFWAGAPEATKAYAITMHRVLENGKEEICWVEYQIDGSMKELMVGAMDLGMSAGHTINKESTYTAPCPSLGESPAFIVTIYALSKQPGFRSGSKHITKEELELELAFSTLSVATKKVYLPQKSKHEAIVLA